MNSTKSIMIVGVGGQGTLLASRVLGSAIMQQGYDVKVSEVHGMSQRGGSVVTYVRYGDKVYSPTIDEGQADVILSFEKLEAARWLSFLKKGGKLITNTQEIDPMPVITGVAQYPDGLVEKIAAAGVDILALDALTLANEAGSSKAINIILVGVLSCFMDFTDDIWENALTGCVPGKFLEINRKAFAMGREYAHQHGIGKTE